ncbi:DUF2057 domain-containing protein [Grimontia hollisae]|uniref:VvgS protein n=1 Tax=Grimontia hollisae CIP 101886 TaxID=675812 RepID=D0ICD7_GRIHO|nr:DUF2057 domain-containing protein [Grimontia hollisae]AMG29930.1 DUF2057 domain-containing protein [Grimontia hollisae]EEY71555.1 VvgS protein [Grimontia hollisae CIP 101886]STO43040.1 Uncharacterized protein conserved in bacteria (DUF2057) [Grimontia hollisae]
MKRIFKSIVFLGGLTPLLAFSQVTINLHKDVEALVVNGEALPISVISKSKFELENGTNQLVVRVSKLVSSGSEFDKFKTDPLVITFDASDTDLTIMPSRDITAERQIKDFKQNPSFTLVSLNGNQIESEQEILPAGPGFLRDYERELVKFNEKRGLSYSKSMADTKAEASSDINEKSNSSVYPVKNAELSNENALILMQADFLRMSAEEQKKFLSWAVQNVRS